MVPPKTLGLYNLEVSWSEADSRPYNSKGKTTVFTFLGTDLPWSTGPPRHQTSRKIPSFQHFSLAYIKIRRYTKITPPYQREVLNDLTLKSKERF
jgi:hypothetical protein